MPVPETTMYKNYGVIFQKNEIGLARQMLAVESVTESFPEQRLSYEEFWLCILTTYPAHHPGSRGHIDNINHWRVVRTGAFLPALLP
jgi:hypothetical protein